MQHLQVLLAFHVCSHLCPSLGQTVGVKLLQVPFHSMPAMSPGNFVLKPPLKSSLTSLSVRDGVQNLQSGWGGRGCSSREWPCPDTFAHEPYEDTVLCCSSCSCSGKFFWLNTLRTGTTPLHRAGILWWGKLLFRRMSDGSGVLFPKGWVPPGPAVPVPRPQQEELCSLGGRVAG